MKHPSTSRLRQNPFGDSKTIHLRLLHNPRVDPRGGGGGEGFRQKTTSVLHVPYPIVLVV